MRVAAVVALAVLVTLGVGAAANGSSVACVAAPVRNTVKPPTFGGPSRVPWMRAGRTVGYLFGYGETLQRLSPGRAALFTGSDRAAGDAMKILWAVRGGSRRLLTIAGDRLDASGAFSESFPVVGVAGAGDWAYYASIVDIPAAGCWRLTVLSPGKRGRFAVLAIDE
jgi:hypothetical protein